MKKGFLLLVMIVVLGQVKAIDYFAGTYQEALQTAKNNNKFILLYFTAKWCGPCKYMSSYILTDPEIEALVSANYIALKLDVDLEENKVIFYKYFQEEGVSVPIFLVINSNEEVINQLLGATKVNQFKKFLTDSNKKKSIYVAKPDTIPKKIVYEQKLKPTFWNKFFYNARVSKWRPGIEIGLNCNNYQPKSSEFDGYRVGFDFGFYFEHYPNKILLRPEINYITKGAKNTNTDEIIRLRYIEIPVKVGIDIFKHRFVGCAQPVRLNLTPYWAYALSGVYKTNNGNNSVQFGTDAGKINRIDYGIKTGLSFQLGTFESSIGYDWGLNDLSNDSQDKLFNRGFYFEWSLTVGR